MSGEQAKDYGIIDAVYSATGNSLIAQAPEQGSARRREPGRDARRRRPRSKKSGTREGHGQGG